jgi:outer membrane lipoprotein-sorting protein
VISEKIITKGLFYFKKEKKLRWEYTDPYRYIIIINGDKIYIKDENRENRFDASSNKVFSEVNAIMVGCIRGTILNDDKQFSADLLENAEFFLVRLHPLTPRLKGSIEEIRIFFDKKSFTVARLEMHESSGDFTKIDFTGMKMNTIVADEVFSVH